MSPRGALAALGTSILLGWGAAALAAPVEVLGLRLVADAALGKSAPERARTLQRLQSQVEEVNGYFLQSEVRLRLDIVQVAFADIGSEDAMAVLGAMQRTTGPFAGMFDVADELGADFTVAVLDRLQLRGAPGCGRAFAVNRTVEEISDLRRAFAVVSIRCGAQTLAHELGHLMGLNHGHLVDECEPGQGHRTALAPHANGYAEGNCDGRPQAGEFGTLMVGGWMKRINGDGRGSLPIFSNPRVRDPRCGARGVCGDERLGDEARVLNENAARYAAHAEPDVHTLRFASAGLANCVARKYRGVEVADLRELSCTGAGIDGLGGIERLTSLRRIDLSGNPRVNCRGLRQMFDGKGEMEILCGSP